MKDVYTLFRVFFTISVLLTSPVIAQSQQDVCHPCSLCHTEPRMFNGTMSNFVIAFCQFKKGDKMTSIPQNLPPRLGTLRLTSHDILELKNTSFRRYPFLQILYVDGNGLQTIRDGSFSQQRFLTELDLKENKVSNIGAETFRGLTSLTKLRLDHNKLENISGGTFSTVPFLKMLDLRVNRINVLEEGAFDKLDYLETLLLSYNRLRALSSKVLGNLMSLTRLELASNQIQRIDEGVFSCAPLIKELGLKGNRLEKVPIESITDLQFLDSLDISENPVSFIGSDAFIGLKSLKAMDLSGCDISGIQDNAFDGLQEISSIHLNNNPIKCDCHLSWLPRWLSRKPKVALDGAVCHSPPEISGQNMTAVTLHSFICGCADCICNPQPNNCSCFKNRTGLSCNDICQSYNDSVSMCRKFGEKCFCKNKTTLQKTPKFANCSFNITSEKCSEHGELQKDGAHLECACKRGFTGNGVNCSDIDECQIGGHWCSKNAHCINTLGSHRCQCHQGFKDKIVPAAGKLCEDIDECNESLPCGQHSQCQNNEGRNSSIRLVGEGYSPV